MDVYVTEQKLLGTASYGLSHLCSLHLSMPNISGVFKELINHPFFCTKTECSSTDPTDVPEQFPAVWTHECYVLCPIYFLFTFDLVWKDGTGTTGESTLSFLTLLQWFHLCRCPAYLPLVPVGSGALRKHLYSISLAKAQA